MKQKVMQKKIKNKNENKKHTVAQRIIYQSSDTNERFY